MYPSQQSSTSPFTLPQRAISAGRPAGVSRTTRRPLATLACGVLAILLTDLPARAADLDNFQSLTQREFRLLSEDFGGALSYKGMVPAEALGITGFDVAVAVTGAELENADLLRRVAGDPGLETTVVMPSIRIVKGLPYNIDIGAMVASVADTDVRLIGGEVRWAFIEGSALLPALALRGAMTKVTGVDQLSLTTGSVDVSISKGFLNITPYGGVGHVWVKSDVDGVAGLSEESFGLNRVFVGVNVNLGVNLAIEADRTGDLTSFGIKAGIRF